MLFSLPQSIWLYRHPIDFRKQIDGLMIIVADRLKIQPTNGDLFIFRNRAANKIKMLVWDNNGFWLLYKRMDRGRFKFPSRDHDVWSLSRDEFSWLLSGLDFTQQKKLPVVTATNFF